ncbi:ATPase [Amycolatopsis sp. NPDC051758]|uniref:RapZ C-terminal domain-containing protein n=1 Tax=Amycolatopsis sp. NPDC051758 TaxID=3363935 RepID=UPI003787407F
MEPPFDTFTWPAARTFGDHGLIVDPDPAAGPLRVMLKSFGHLHEPIYTGRTAAADHRHLVLDVRALFADPYLKPEMREMTGRDDAVRANVLAQPGAVAYVIAHAEAIAATVAPAKPGLVDASVGCAGGRHRSVVIAEALSLVLAHGYGIAAEIHHRDIHRPVVRR